MSERLVFELVGRDASLRLALDRAGDAADRMRRRIVVDAAESDAALRRMSRSAEASSGRTTGILGRLGSALTPGIGGLRALGAAAAIPQIAGLASGLAQLLPAAGVAATGLLAAASAGAALKVGMLGVGDAVTAAFDPSKAKNFDAALQRLSPNAREFVLALQGIKPQLNGLKNAVQDRLFDGLAVRLKQTATATLPAFKQAVGDSASTLNLMGRDLLATTAHLGESGALGTALAGANRGLLNLSGLPGTVVQGLVQIGAAAAPAFQRLTASAGDALDKVRGKLANAFASGAMQQSINVASGLVGQLAGTIGNIGRTIGNVFGPAAAAGSGFLGVLSSIAKTAATVTATPQAQATFQGLFQTLAAVGHVISGVLGSALTTVMPLLGTLVTSLAGPIQSLAGQLLPVLSGLVGTLGSALQPVIGALGQGLATIAPVVGTLVSALAGALTPVLGVLGNLLATLIPPLATIIGQVGTALAPVLTQLGMIVAQVGSALLNLLAPVLAQMPTLVGPLITVAGTLLSTFGQIVTQLLVALQPALTTLGDSLGQLAVAVAPLLTVLAQLITQGLQAIMPVLPPIISLIGQLASIFASQLASTISTVVIPAVRAITSLLRGDFHGALTSGKEAVSGMVATMRSEFLGLPAKVAGALGGFAAALLGKINPGMGQAVGVINRQIGEAVRTIAGLPGRAASALGNLGGRLYGAGSALIGGFISGIVSRISAVRSTLSNLTSQLTSWKGPPRRDATLLTPAGRLLIRGLIRGITATTPALRAALAKTTRDIGSWVHGSMTRALSSGSASQIKAGYASTAALLRTQASQLQSVINRDLAKLKLKGLGTARAAILRELGTARAAAGSNSALSRALAADNKKLQALVSQRDKIAARIAQAKQAAADFASSAKQFAGLSTIETPRRAGDIKGGLAQRLAQINQFTGYIKTLAKRGLSKGLLQQILQMGPDQGLAYASALASADKRTFSQINALQARIDKSSTNLGKLGADALYDAGAQAGKGFLAGLAAQQKAIENQMIKIAKGMEAAIRKALGIKSPARVMMPVGRAATDGVTVGTLQGVPALASAMRTVSDTVANGVTTAGLTGPGTTPAARTPRHADQGTVIHIHVDGTVMDPIAVGRKIQQALLELKRVKGGAALGVA
jgi:phage-related protein